MRGLFIPEITAEMFRNGCLESIEALMAEGEIYDIDYSPWIPCSERLPENNKNVLATDGLDVFIAWHNPEKEEWFSFDELFDEQYPILAWQPLPEPWRKDEEE